MGPSKVDDDVTCQILIWLPVISVSRFKRVCRSWRALIESSYFIKQHLHLHHYDPSLKDKNRSLIYLLRRSQKSPLSFPLASVESFEEPKVCLEPNCLDLHGCFPVAVLEIVSCDGLICLSLLNCKEEHSICLWNPATKQSRVLPQSPFHDNSQLSIGFGYDIKTKDYKVVRLIRDSFFAKPRYEVYSLNTDSWRRLTSGLLAVNLFGNTRMPFNNGMCFFWGYYVHKNKGILCFDFSTEMFRCIPLPRAFDRLVLPHMGVVNDKIACFLTINGYLTELLVFNDYGRAHESWTKLYTVDAYPIIRRRPLYCETEALSMNGNYIFFTTTRQMCRFNVVTKEINCFTHENMPYSSDTLVEFKESLVSVGGGNNQPICINKDNGNLK